jgi:hypothetical protein
VLARQRRRKCLEKRHLKLGEVRQPAVTWRFALENDALGCAEYWYRSADDWLDHDGPSSEDSEVLTSNEERPIKRGAFENPPRSR